MVAERIIQLRTGKGWSQEELALAIGASRDIISKYERGNNLPSIEMASKMAKAFGVSLDFLINGKEDNRLPQQPSTDEKMIRRIQAIENLDKQSRTVLLRMVDAFLRDEITRKAHQEFPY